MALKVNAVNFEAQNFAALIQVLQNTRRANRGVRISHLSPVIICGLCREEGIRPKQLADSLNVTIQAARSKLMVGVKHGYFHRNRFTYYLAYNGQVIHDKFMKMFRGQLEKLTMNLIRRAANRTEGYWQRKARELELELANLRQATKQPSNAG